jgi:AcrR family transcriptional regulator
MLESKQNKGVNTKAQILKSARYLFYHKGYSKTTTRQIAKHSDTNLGLISYYFKSKANLGLTIYGDLRKQMRKMVVNEFEEESALTFLLHSVIDMKLLVTNSPYRDLYLSISRDDEFISFIKSRIIEHVKKYMSNNVSEDYLDFTCITISTVKPELVRFITSTDMANDEQLNKLIHYYNELYISILNKDSALANEVYAQLGKFYVNIVDNFTPIITRISE